jgi:hypothetical protein
MFAAPLGCAESQLAVVSWLESGGLACAVAASQGAVKLPGEVTTAQLAATQSEKCFKQVHAAKARVRRSMPSVLMYAAKW